LHSSLTFRGWQSAHQNKWGGGLPALGSHAFVIVKAAKQVASSPRKGKIPPASLLPNENQLLFCPSVRTPGHRRRSVCLVVCLKSPISNI
jgi:hypothetical protein